MANNPFLVDDPPPMSALPQGNGQMLNQALDQSGQAPPSLQGQPGAVKQFFMQYLQKLGSNLDSDGAPPQSQLPDNGQGQNLAGALQQNFQQPNLAPQHSAIRQRLANGVQGMSDALAAYAHIPTQFQKQQQSRQLDIAQQQADTMENYRKMQGDQIQGGLPQPVTSEMSNLYKQFGINVPEGTMMNAKQHSDLLKQALQNKGKTDVATINQGVQVPVPPDIAAKFGISSETIGDKVLSRLTGTEGKNVIKTSKMIDGVPHQVFQNKATGEVLHDNGIDTAIAINQAKAKSFADARASVTPFTTFDSQGHLVTISAGQAIATGVPPASAWNTLYGATGSTKSQGQAAGAVAEHIPAYQQAVRNLEAKGQLGAVMGRLNTYLNSGYGGDDPDIAEFVTTTGLLKSGAVRAHFGARGGAQILSKFDSMLNTAQNANAIIGSTNAMASFLNTYKANASNSNTPQTTITPTGSGKPTHVYVPGKGIQPIGK